MALVSLNPSTGQIIKEYQAYDVKKVEELLNISEDTFHSWKTTSFSERSSLMENLANQLLIQRDELALLITTEMGKVIKESRAEVEKCAWVCKYYAQKAEEHLSSEVIESDAFFSRVNYEPLGAILGIMPWNFPFWQVFRFLAPTVMAGNVVLLKHASNVQGCALAIEKLMGQAGFPDGVFTTLVIGSDLVAGLIKNDIIKAVTLTGSEHAGSQVAMEAGKNIKKAVLELGGSNAFIILDDANIEEAVNIGITARMMNAGQSCIAAKRFIIHKQIAEEFVALFVERTKSLIVSDPTKEETEMGPLANENQAIEVEKQVNNSINQGAKLLCGGKRSGAFYDPAILTNINSKMPVFCEEVFGPVAPIITFKEEEEAIALSNQSKFGLGVSIITNDLSRAERMIPKFEDGAVFINSLVKSDPRLPFGGTKFSGYGRELSRHGILEFVNAKTVYINKMK